MGCCITANFLVFSNTCMPLVCYLLISKYRLIYTFCIIQMEIVGAYYKMCQRITLFCYSTFNQYFFPRLNRNLLNNIVQLIYEHALNRVPFKLFYSLTYSASRHVQSVHLAPMFLRWPVFGDL